MEVRLLSDVDASDFRGMRLKMLGEEPDVFLATLDEETNKPIDDLVDRLRKFTSENYILGAFDNGKLVGCAGFVREQRTKLRHKGNVWGMYVIPALRRKGIGRQLLEEIVMRGRSLESLEQLNLSVLSDNTAATKLYQSVGFVIYGVEKRALKLVDCYKDEDLMVLVLD